MASGKKSFILYCDLIHTFNELTDVEAGQLIKHLLAYVNDQNPQTDNKLIKIAFEPIKQQLKRDLKDWEVIREKRSEAGKLSAVKRAEQKQQVLTSVDTSQQPSTNPTVNVTGIVTVNDNVIVRDDGKMFHIPTLESVIEQFKIKGKDPSAAKDFYDNYQANGWMMGKSPMVRWEYAVEKWKPKDKAFSNAASLFDKPKPNSAWDKNSQFKKRTT